MKRKDWKKYDPEYGKYYALMMRMGTVMLLSILGFFGLGLLAIKVTGNNPAFLIGFIFAGIFMGFAYMWRAFNKFE